MKKYYCDKCGAELSLDLKGNVKIGLWEHYEPEDNPSNAWEELGHDSFKVHYYDICDGCAWKLIEFITGKA